MDIAGASLGLLISAPIMLIAAIAIRCTMGKPCLFRQNRGGLHGTVFTLYKFRTMVEATDAAGAVLPDNERLTPIGRFLRQTSIDELPQLWNVLRGDMSLVGPRPWMSEYLDIYDDWQRRRHEMKPGITGWSQIRGRNAISWDERFELDIWYIDNWTLTLDFNILASTIARVLRREGISQDNHATMPKFERTSNKLDSKSAPPSPIISETHDPVSPNGDNTTHGLPN